MITLSATDSLSAVAGANSAISYTLFGDRIVDSLDSFSVLGQGVLTTSATTISSTGTVRLVKTVTLSNTSSSIVSGIKFFVNGVDAANQIVTLSIPANGSAKFDANGWTVYDANGSILTFGLNGRGIVSITRTAGNGAVGTTDTYTITYTDNTTSTYQVKNGSSVIVGATTVVTPAAGPSVSDADAGENVDLRFSLPRARQVTAGTTNTITPATNPSVSSANDVNGDVSLTFNLPRAATLSVGPTTTVTPVTSPSVSRATDANGDVTDTFSLPRARNVAAGTTTTGNPGTNAAVNSAQDANGDVTLNFTIPRGDVGPTGPAANAFTNIAVSGQTTVSAEVANDTLTLVNGTGIEITTDAANDSITITNNDRGSQQNIFKNIAVSGQSTIVADTNDDTLTIVGSGSVTVTTDAATDTVTIAGAVAAPQNCFANVSVGTTPTPTVLQADLAADTLTVNAGTGITLTADAATDTFTIANAGVTSVNGQTGAVTVPVLTAVTRTAPTASASTALTTIQSYPIATGEIVAGSEYEFYASLRVINTTTATNAVVTLSVGAVNVLVLTQAIGTTAAAAPGAAVELYGRITFYSATSAEAYIRASKQAAVAFDAVANTSASVTVAAATATTLDLKFNTSGTTSTFIARQATIRKVK